ncbi:MAG: V-type ATP synthase subunit I [Clostridia bacterium]|nr:V-type ATP synthase subunit I [Clostridia bacterium]
MIVPMKRLSLIALKADEERLLEALQRIGTVEIIDISEDAGGARLEAAQNRMQRLSDSMEAIKPFAPKKSFFTPQKREVALSDIRADVDRAADVTDAVETLLHEKATLVAEREKKLQLRTDLLPWEPLNQPMSSIRNTKRVCYFIGFCAQKDRQKLAEQEFLETEFLEDSANSPAIVACSAADFRVAQNFIKSIEWTDYAFPKSDRTPSEEIRLLNKRVEEIDRAIEDIDKQIVSHGEQLELLENAADATAIEMDRSEATCGLKHTNSAFLLEGWVREDRVEVTEDTIKGVTDAYSFEVRDPNEDEIPPSVVRNNKVVAPFEEVQTLYSRPDPYGIDGTPYMTPFYILLFGLMLSDTGYGILLALGALAYIKIKKPTGMSGGISRVLAWGGLSTAIWGIFVGSFFGISRTPASGAIFDVISAFFDRLGIFPVWLDPMTDSMQMLALCMGLGILHMVSGYLINAIDCFRRGDWKTAIFDELSWVMIILGLVIGFLPTIAGMAGMEANLPETVTKPAVYVALFGVLLIVLFKGRNAPKFFGKITGGLGELYNITGVLSDVLSYARLFALGIATGVIGQVFNTLCGMLMQGKSLPMQILGGIVSIILLILLHTFNLAINTLGAFVHCARLQYVEFYGRFYQAGGRAFRPLAYNTKHIQVTK